MPLSNGLDGPRIPEDRPFEGPLAYSKFSAQSFSLCRATGKVLFFSKKLVPSVLHESSEAAGHGIVDHAWTNANDIETRARQRVCRMKYAGFLKAARSGLDVGRYLVKLTWKSILEMIRANSELDPRDDHAKLSQFSNPEEILCSTFLS